MKHWNLVLKLFWLSKIKISSEDQLLLMPFVLFFLIGIHYMQRGQPLQGMELQETEEE